MRWLTSCGGYYYVYFITHVFIPIILFIICK